MDAALLSEVLGRLAEFGFRESNGWLRKGTCPHCGHKSLYAHGEHPWVLRCERLNHCGWEGHVKELYPDLFNNWSERVRRSAGQAGGPRPHTRQPHGGGRCVFGPGARV